jgi:hypothetical protein|nr:MAG TPA: hypothetical protein [Bacteriophage sp.]
MATFLGKEIKSYESKWEIIKSSIMKISKKELKKVQEITVHQSEFDEGQLYAVIKLDEGCVSFTIDLKAAKKLEEGDKLDPASILVYKMTNGEKEITRLYGEAL